MFHANAGGYGLLTSIMAIGTIFGALYAAGRPTPSMRLLAGSAALFGTGCAAAALAPTYAIFGVTLLVIGLSALTFTTATNSMMQLTTEPRMRGRVMAIRVGIALGCTPFGAPIVGLVADHLGARWALGIGAAAGFAAALVGLWHLARSKELSPLEGPTGGQPARNPSRRADGESMPPTLRAGREIGRSNIAAPPKSAIADP